MGIAHNCPGVVTPLIPLRSIALCLHETNLVAQSVKRSPQADLCVFVKGKPEFRVLTHRDYSISAKKILANLTLILYDCFTSVACVLYDCCMRVYSA